MSAENLQRIVEKAVSDPSFRDLLFSNPAKAVEGFELSEQELLIIKSLAREKFDAGATELEERISRNRLF